jgi:TolB-like protein
MRLQDQPAPLTLSFLPLQSLSEDPRIQLFCMGLQMDLITDLARFRSFQIIPADSQEALPADLDYLVKGIARYHGDRFQLNLQLIRARENRLVWAEKFGDTLEHIFQIEEAIVRKIVISVQEVVDHDVLSQIRRRPLTDLSVYESWLYGMEELTKGTLEADEKARTYFQSAIEQDPGFARAYTGMSLTYFNEWSCLLWDKWEENQQQAVDWALKAVDLDTRDPLNAYILGKCYLFYKQYGKAEYYVRKALELHPAQPRIIAGIAFCLIYLGKVEEGMRLYEEAVELDTSGNGFIPTGTLVYFENGLYEKAIELGEKSSGVMEWIDFQATMAAIYFQTGQLDKMWICWKEYVEYFQQKMYPDQAVDEQLALEWMITVNPYQEYTHHQPFWDFMKEHLGTSPITISVEKEKLPAYDNQLLREGNIWQLSYKGKTVQLAELKGLHDITRLIEQPNTPIHCADLMGLTVLENGAPVLDEKAKRSYEKRLLHIQESLAEAEQMQQYPTIERLQQEYDELLDHLSQSLGKGGRSRTTSRSLEKARSAVTWRIRSAIKKIKEVHPELAKHFKVTIQTGYFCTYQPEQPIHWQT